MYIGMATLFVKFFKRDILILIAQLMVLGKISRLCVLWIETFYFVENITGS